MREIKFNYICIRKNGYSFNRTFTFLEIENGQVKVWEETNITYSGEVYRRQFTGLKDKNGNEIYFKDLVKAPSGNVFEVVFNEEELKIMLLRQNVYYNFNVLLYEVIGNIYESPNLLK